MLKLDNATMEVKRPAARLAFNAEDLERWWNSRLGRRFKQHMGIFIRPT
jgi:hypothetical protein